MKTNDNARRSDGKCHRSAGAVQDQNAVTVYLDSKQLPLVIAFWLCTLDWLVVLMLPNLLRNPIDSVGGPSGIDVRSLIALFVWTVGVL